MAEMSEDKGAEVVGRCSEAGVTEEQAVEVVGRGSEVGVSAEREAEAGGRLSVTSTGVRVCQSVPVLSPES